MAARGLAESLSVLVLAAVAAGLSAAFAAAFFSSVGSSAVRPPPVVVLGGTVTGVEYGSTITFYVEMDVRAVERLQYTGAEAWLMLDAPGGVLFVPCTGYGDVLPAGQSSIGLACRAPADRVADVYGGTVPGSSTLLREAVLAAGCVELEGGVEVCS